MRYIRTLILYFGIYAWVFWQTLKVKIGWKDE